MKLLILENGENIDDAYSVLDFIKKFEEENQDNPGSEVEIVTRMNTLENEELFKKVMSCDIIACKTFFIQHSYYAFFDMVRLLSKIDKPLEIHIDYGDSREDELGDDLYEFINRELDDKSIYAIRQHKIFRLGHKGSWRRGDLKSVLMDLSPRVSREQDRLDEIERESARVQRLKETARERPTGQRVKVVNCTASFNNSITVPIGQTVDVLDCSEFDPNPARGLWVWGGAEPIKLLNEQGIVEYEVVTKMDIDEVFVEILKICHMDSKEISQVEADGLKRMIELEDLDAGSAICDTLGVPRRGNRSLVRDVISKFHA